MRIVLRKIALCIAIAHLAVSLSPASEEVLSQRYSKSGGSFIKITSVFGGGKSSGYSPYVVTIRNNTDRDRTWTVRINNNNSWGTLKYDKVARYEVPAGSEISADLQVPVPPLLNNSSTHYQNWIVAASSPGLDSASRIHSSQTEADWPSIALSEPLARRSLSSLDSEKEDNGFGDNPFGYSYNDVLLPSEWIGYTGLDALMIDETTWRALESSQRQAIVEWLRLGGRIEYFSKEKPRNLVHPTLQRLLTASKNGNTLFIGSGAFRMRTWDGDTVPDSLVNAYRSGIPIRSSYISNDFDGRWELKRQFGEKKFNILLIFIILFTFAIVIGPVNLFWLAKAGRRHRLFITTPIISLSAVILMSVLIYFQDGMGGKGSRAAIAELQSNSDEMRVYLNQEQYSRTGVIISTGFTADEEIELSPVKLPDSPWNRFSTQNGTLGSIDFVGKKYSGDLFTSRSEQAFAIRTVRPTRSRIEIRKPGEGDAPPELFSSLAFSLTDFIYRSSDGTTYQAPAGTRIDPGNPIPLQAISELEFTNWIKENRRNLSSTISKKIDSRKKVSDTFFAMVADPSELLVDTHPGIDWENDIVILVGNLNAPLPDTAQKKKEEEAR